MYDYSFLISKETNFLKEVVPKTFTVSNIDNAIH